MRAFFETPGMLGPVYRLIGHGFTDREIAGKLQVDEIRVNSCISWTLRFLHFTEREQLVADAGGLVLTTNDTKTVPEGTCN